MKPLMNIIVHSITSSMFTIQGKSNSNSQSEHVVTYFFSNIQIRPFQNNL